MAVQPTSSTTLQRPDLGLALEEVDLARQGFVGIQVLPIFGTEKKESNFSKIPVESLLKDPEAAERAADGSYNRIDWEFETDYYSCKEYGLEGRIDDSDKEHYSTYLDVEAANARIVNHALMMRQERRIAALLFSATTFSGYTGGVSVEWDSSTCTATPVTNIQTAKDNIRANCGLVANSLLLSYKNWSVLRRSSQILDYTKYTQPTGGLLKVEQVKEALELENIFIGGAIYDSAKEGQTKSIADIWDDEYALVFYRAPDALLGDIKVPTLGRTFLWTADSPDNATVETYYSDEVRSNVVRVRQQVHEKIFLAETGYLLSNIHT